MYQPHQKFRSLYLEFLCIITLIIPKSIFSDPRSVALIQDINAVSMEKGVDIISSIHEKSGHDHSKDSFRYPEEYSAASKETNNMSSEEGEENTFPRISL